MLSAHLPQRPEHLLNLLMYWNLKYLKLIFISRNVFFNLETDKKQVIDLNEA